MSDDTKTPAASTLPVMIGAWVWVTVPFAWGLYELILRARNLFGA